MLLICGIKFSVPTYCFKERSGGRPSGARATGCIACAVPCWIVIPVIGRWRRIAVWMPASFISRGFFCSIFILRGRRIGIIFRCIIFGINNCLQKGMDSFYIG